MQYRLAIALVFALWLAGCGSVATETILDDRRMLSAGLRVLAKDPTESTWHFATVRTVDEAGVDVEYFDGRTGDKLPKKDLAFTPDGILAVERNDVVLVELRTGTWVPGVVQALDDTSATITLPDGSLNRVDRTAITKPLQ